MIKICGVTRPGDAIAAADAGADAVGINLWPRSKRFADADAARAVAAAIPAGVLRVGVFVDAAPTVVKRAVDALSLDYVQLHGDEPAEALDQLGGRAFKAVRLSGPAVVEGIDRWPGRFVLVDAYRPGDPGGTGETADWDLAAEAARRRPVWLAGGLTAANVREAIRAVRPYGVDVASGVESSPGVKSAPLIEAFVQAAHAA